MHINIHFPKIISTGQDSKSKQFQSQSHQGRSVMLTLQYTIGWDTGSIIQVLLGPCIIIPPLTCSLQHRGVVLLGPISCLGCMYVFPTATRDATLGISRVNSSTYICAQCIPLWDVKLFYIHINIWYMKTVLLIMKPRHVIISMFE